MRALVVAAVLAICAQAQDLRPGLVATYSGGGHRVRMIVPAPDFYLVAAAREKFAPDSLAVVRRYATRMGT